MNGPDTATVFDIQRFSFHDGPGIRTTVFFKGCSLRCGWCQNPESLAPQPELAFYRDRCLDCDRCVTACSLGAITGRGPDLRLDRSLCDACGACVDVCPSQALRMIGRTYTPGALVDACLRDRAFFSASGGGVTLSGGEPVLNSGFLERFLPLLRAEGIHVLIQTAGHYPWRLIEPLLPLVDAVMLDWKVPASAYARHTGRDATLVLETLRGLARSDVALTVRTPVIPGVNTSEQAIASMAATLKEAGVTSVQLLTYHSLWEAKLPRLHTRQQPLGAVPAADHRVVAERFRAHGVDAIAA